MLQLSYVIEPMRVFHAYVKWVLALSVLVIGGRKDVLRIDVGCGGILMCVYMLMLV